MAAEDTPDWEAAWTPVFLPPPPRPPFLETHHLPPDGLTTCDLCTWALQPSAPFGQRPVPADAQDGDSWAVTLVVVSLLSALLGATLMLTLTRCKQRLTNRRARGVSLRREASLKEANVQHSVGDGGVLSWLRPRGPEVALPLSAPVATANHYTVPGEGSSGNPDEALYAELDRPAYQNTGYHSDNEPGSSAPSSAYYSDLSASDRMYEAVGAGSTQWELPTRPASSTRLTAITESVPSDYV